MPQDRVLRQFFFALASHVMADGGARLYVARLAAAA